MTNDISGWLILTYTLPAEPSRKRVAVWRRLRKLGAVYLSEGFWFFPNTEASARNVTSVVAEVEKLEGTAVAFAAYDLDPLQKERLRTRFLDARNEEYGEIRHDCEKFLSHIEHERQREHFTFSEVEELEEDLDKRRRWLEEVRQRDVFGSPQYDAALGAIEQCQEALVSFTEQAYESAKQADAPGE